MAKSNFGYIGAGGLAGLHKGVEEILADRFAAQQMAKEEALAREKLWQANLENQRNFTLNQEQLGVSKGTLKLAQERAAREAAADARPAGPKPRLVSGITRPGKPGKYTVILDDNNPSGAPLSELQEYEAPAKPNTTPVRGVKGPDGKPVIRFYDESGQPIGTDVPEYEDPQRGAGAGTPKPATGVQQKAMGFYERMNAANKVIEATEGQLTWGDKQILSSAPETGFLENLSKYGLSSAGKQYAQAMTDFMEAGLRDASGAAINRTEFPTYRRIYQAHASDTPELVAQRQAARDGLIRQMKMKAGRAFEEFYGDTPPDDAPARPGGGDRPIPEYIRDPKTGKLVLKKG